MNGFIGLWISTSRPAIFTSATAYFMKLISKCAASFINSKSYNATQLDIYIYKSKSATNDLSSNNTTVICVLIVLPVTAFDSSHFFPTRHVHGVQKKRKKSIKCVRVRHTFLPVNINQLLFLHLIVSADCLPRDTVVYLHASFTLIFAPLKSTAFRLLRVKIWGGKKASHHMKTKPNNCFASWLYSSNDDTLYTKFMRIQYILHLHCKKPEH